MGARARSRAPTTTNWVPAARDERRRRPDARRPEPARRYTFVGGSNLMMFKASKNKDAAWALMKYLSEDAVQKDYADLLGMFPARLGAAGAGRRDRRQPRGVLLGDQAGPHVRADPAVGRRSRTPTRPLRRTSSTRRPGRAGSRSATRRCRSSSTRRPRRPTRLLAQGSRLRRPDPGPGARALRPRPASRPPDRAMSTHYPQPRSRRRRHRRRPARPRAAARRRRSRRDRASPTR